MGRLFFVISVPSSSSSLIFPRDPAERRRAWRGVAWRGVWLGKRKAESGVGGWDGAARQGVARGSTIGGGLLSRWTSNHPFLPPPPPSRPRRGVGDVVVVVVVVVVDAITERVDLGKSCPSGRIFAK